ncbi:MAG: hypothetical protein HQL01_00825 [Nitrospirae bacterium]|nr:hypothetical protein [Nitrospirota bacterium]
MPIYEYKCNACENVLEITQKITDDPITECPKCAGQLKKLVSATSFVLKGNGWYVTDYPSKDRQSSQTTEKPSEGSETSDKKTTESKPDAAKSDSTTSEAAKPDAAKTETVGT